MEPPDFRAPVDAALLASLRAWCEGGAFPTLTEPLRVASIAPHAGLDGVACVLDGSHELARLGRWRGWAWRLRILLRESVAGRVARPGDPWDCGWWRDSALGPAEKFRPRRATLLMVRELTPTAAATLLFALRAKSIVYDKPVRVLVISEAASAGVVRL
ncbi:hypothetical protein SNE35_03315 [Paucibacter sp. R3-3]|uniref:Uncharacterized protein n=1 Tax=Roseateles agri TaxID=3098619 RepID=A0ABU5DBL8_9BURK|nr:hypothetical protein [Paucibacter sp. R3-3]MDY0743514.1 hypothetical protein [Paucibacter sp. R3-3]